MDWEIRLITLYLFICKQYQEHLWAYCQRFSLYVNPEAITDEEVLCIFLWGVMDKRRELTDVHRHTERHLRHLFPRLPSYVGFVQRLNRLADVFGPLVEAMQQAFPGVGGGSLERLIDSLPIRMAHARRRKRARVAPELANPGFCASKGEYYYGVKLHVLGQRRPGTLPLPEAVSLTPASDHDLTALRQILPYLHGGQLFADKAYRDELLRRRALAEQGLAVLTPVKKAKGQAYLDTVDQWLSTAVSQVRQPIESLFNWIEEKTGIQQASKVRSSQGLLVHVFGRLAAALWLLAQPESA